MFWLGVGVSIVIIAVCVVHYIVGETSLGDSQLATGARRQKLSQRTIWFVTVLAITGIFGQIKPLELFASGLIIMLLISDCYRMLRFESRAQDTCEQGWGCIGIITALVAIVLISVRLWLVLIH